MRQLFVFSVLSVLLLGLSHSHAGMFDCEETLPDTTDSSSSSEPEVSIFKRLGCQIKKGAKKLSEKAKDLGADIKDEAKKLGERAKDLGSGISDRIADFRDKLAKDSAEDMSKERGFLANVEIINPDLLKGEQQCGHGHILDALGNCSKLRK